MIGAGRTHGLRSTYKDGCKCDDCRLAEAEWTKAYRARVAAREPHGTFRRYNAGCRCVECREALKVRQRENRALPPKLMSPPPSREWVADRACADMPTDVFFPERGFTEYGYLRVICSACPVRLECLEEALYYESFHGQAVRFGFQGGMSPDERAVEASRRTGRPIPIRAQRRMGIDKPPISPNHPTMRGRS